MKEAYSKAKSPLKMDVDRLQIFLNIKVLFLISKESKSDENVFRVAQSQRSVDARET